MNIDKGACYPPLNGSVYSNTTSNIERHLQDVNQKYGFELKFGNFGPNLSIGDQVNPLIRYEFKKRYGLRQTLMKENTHSSRYNKVKNIDFNRHLAFKMMSSNRAL